MLFPDSDRVVYEKNTLDRVVCQLRFPAILRIASELPIAYQDRIRASYPHFNEKREQPISGPEGLSETVLLKLLNSVTAYEFASKDKNWTVTLTTDFLALATTDYDRWENFREHFRQPLAALMEVYSPEFFSRTGLRYQNVIRRSRIGCDDAKWGELFNSALGVEVSDDEVANAIDASSHQCNIKNDGNIQIRYGLVKDTKTDELCYMIDADFFTDEQTEYDNVESTLNRFNRDAGRLFRWTISDRLHNAMEPTTIARNEC